MQHMQREMLSLFHEEGERKALSNSLAHFLLKAKVHSIDT